MKKLIVFMLALVSVFSLASCKKDGNKEFNYTFTEYDVKSVSVEGVNLVTPGKLTVAMSTDFQPYEFIDLTKEGQDKFIGSDVMLAKTMAKALGLELVIKSMDFDATMVALDNGIADVAISGFSWTADRAASYLFTDCYFEDGDGGQAVVIKKSQEATLKTIAALNTAGLKIAAQNGAIQQDLVKTFLPNATMIAIDDLNAAYDVLDAGGYDGVAVAVNVANALVAAKPDKFAISEPFDFDDSGSYALVKKENTALAEALNKVIAQLGSAKYAKWVEEATSVFAGLGDNASEEIKPE